MSDWLVPFNVFEAKLGLDGKPFSIGLRRGTMRVELFRPVGRDVQTPHDQDELYIIFSGSGTFSKEGEVRPVKAGDVIFVEARARHRFETFSDDFITWVIFWGPQGGEKEKE